MKFIKGKIGDFFDVGRGTSGITEEFVYNNQGTLPVISATSNNFDIFGFVNSRLFEETYIDNAIIIVRVGKAGTCRSINKKIAITENVLSLSLKKKYKGKINLKWFSYYINDILCNNARGEREGQRNISKEIIDRIEIKIPKSIKIQEEYSKKYLFLEDKLAKLEFIIGSLRRLVSKEIYDNQKYIKKPIGKIFKVDSGIRITEPEAYNHQGQIPVITSQNTNKGATWLVDKKWLKTKGKIIDEECITWTKEGYAGKMFYRNTPFFPIDVCGYLILEKEFKNKLNLFWFMYSQQQKIYQYVYSKGNQGKLYQEPISRIEIKIPKDFKYQKRISEHYLKLHKILQRLYELQNDLNNLRKKTLI